MTAPTPIKPPVMTARQFVQEFARRQKTLLDTLALQLRRGELQLETGVRADRCVENIVTAWCEDGQPDVDLHMLMTGAVFLVALYDQLYGVAGDDDEDDDEPRGPTAADVAMEALKTIQAIWGNHAAKNRR